MQEIEEEIEYQKNVSRIVRTDKKFKPKGNIIKGYREEEIYEIIGRFLKTFLIENEINTDIVDFQIIGSRNKGTANSHSDLDVLIEYNNDKFGEDSLYNDLKDKENQLFINGIEVDFNPITATKSGTIEEWLDQNYDYDKYKEAIKTYTKYFIQFLHEEFKDKISYTYKVIVIENEETNKYTVLLGIDIDNYNKDQIIFITDKEYEKFCKENKLEFIGNFYNASIIGKSRDEFCISDAKKDFLSICDFNYLRNEKSIENVEEEIE